MIMMMIIGGVVAGLVAAILPDQSAPRAAYLGAGLVGTVAAALVVGCVI